MAVEPVDHQGEIRWRSTVALVAVLAALAAPALLAALDAPGAPGDASVWAPAAKDFLGTSVVGSSRVYFTGAEGVLGEVFYPTLDKVQNVDMQVLVTDAIRTWGVEERKQKTHDVSLIHKRAINNSGAGDNSRTLTAAKRAMLVASEPNSTSSALAISRPWKTVNGKVMVSNGFVGRNDGWTDLFSGASDKTMDWTFDGSFGGNVAQ
jgi:glucoamylase